MPKLTHDHISGQDRRHEAYIQERPSYALLTRRLFVDSRDASVRRGPFDFTIRLDGDVGRNRYRNVTSVELKACCIPKVASEDYVILDIEQLKDSNIDSSVPHLNDGFAVSFFDNSSLAPGDVKLSDKNFSQRVLFDPPKTLDRLDIKLRKHDGSLITDADTGGTSNVTSFLFDITMLGI